MERNKMKRILLLEEVVDEVLRNHDREACFFGTDNFSFPTQGLNRAAGPYTFLFYALSRIPEDLSKEFYAVPYVPGDLRNEGTFNRIRELKRRFHFIEDFAVTGKGRYKETGNGQTIEQEGIFLDMRLFKGLRPLARIPPQYSIERIKTADLQKGVPDPTELLDYVAEKIRAINKKYNQEV